LECAGEATIEMERREARCPGSRGERYLTCGPGVQELPADEKAAKQFLSCRLPSCPNTRTLFTNLLVAAHGRAAESPAQNCLASADSCNGIPGPPTRPLSAVRGLHGALTVAVIAAPSDQAGRAPVQEAKSNPDRPVPQNPQQKTRSKSLRVGPHRCARTLVVLHTVGLGPRLQHDFVRAWIGSFQKQVRCAIRRSHRLSQRPKRLTSRPEEQRGLAGSAPVRRTRRPTPRRTSRAAIPLPSSPSRGAMPFRCPASLPPESSDCGPAPR
jgi:hypothetical protein